MSHLLSESPAAQAWVDRAKAGAAARTTFGRIVGSVVWSDVNGPDGYQLVPLDPLPFVTNINENGLALFKGHDPGLPVGRVLAAEMFTSESGMRFVAAVLGYYQGGERLSFHDLALDALAGASPPKWLPELTDASSIIFGTDPREVEPEWVDDVLQGAPLPVERIELSHNAAEVTSELIVVATLLTTLVWNPFTTAVASEAGKETYAAVRRWMGSLVGRLAERRNPILEVRSRHAGCHISFLFRGRDVNRHYAAHGALPLAAASAQQLVENMKSRGLDPATLVYEFQPQDSKWFPSYAELHDGRFCTDNNVLIAMEQLPTSLSIGIHDPQSIAGRGAARGQPKGQ